MEVWILIFSIVCIIIILFTGRTRKRQQRNVHTAEQVLKKLNGFIGESLDARILGYLRKIDPFVFEELLLTSFQRKGFTIQRNQRYTGDGGIDGRVYFKGKLFLIQAKRYKSYVNTRHLADFSSLIVKNSAEGGYFIHTGKTGKETYQFYKNSKIEIISGKKLIKLIIN